MADPAKSLEPVNWWKAAFIAAGIIGAAVWSCSLTNEAPLPDGGEDEDDDEEVDLEEED